MLLPALNQARERAKSSGCVNQLKQFGPAMYAYHDDYKEFPSYGTTVDGSCWDVMIAPYVGYSKNSPNESFHCPSGLPRPDGPAKSRGYFMNGNVACDPPLRTVGKNRRDSEVMLLTDFWHAGLNYGESGYGGNVYNLTYLFGTATTDGQYIAYRHTGSANLLRKGGHVQSTARGFSGKGENIIWLYYFNNPWGHNGKYFQDGQIVQ
jgi:hypothetical protein